MGPTQRSTFLWRREDTVLVKHVHISSTADPKHLKGQDLLLVTSVFFPESRQWLPYCEYFIHV